MDDLDRYRWDEFQMWCIGEGVGLDDEADWGAWWDCWKSAIEAYAK